MKKILLISILILGYTFTQLQAQNVVAQFDGTGDAQIVFNKGFSPDSLSTYTIEFWMNPNDNSANNNRDYVTIALSRVGSDLGWGVFRMQFQEADLSLEVGVDIRNTPDDIIQSPATVDLDDWQHFAYVFENGNHTLYKNGVLFDFVESSENSITSVLWDGNGAWKLGHYLGLYLGVIDEVRLWDTVRTVDEIHDNAALGYDDIKDQPGLVAYYSFNAYDAGDDMGDAEKAGTPGTGITFVDEEIDIPPDLVPESVNELTSETNINLYPNPANNKVCISNLYIANIAVYTYEGKLVKQFENQNEVAEIDISGLEKGLYF